MTNGIESGSDVITVPVKFKWATCMLLIRCVLSHSLHSEPREQCQEGNNGRLLQFTCGTVAYLLFCNTKRNSVSNTRSPMSFHRYADLLFSAFCPSMFMLTDCNLARFDNISHTFYIPAMGSCHAFRLLWFHRIAYVYHGIYFGDEGNDKC